MKKVTSSEYALKIFKYATEYEMNGDFIRIRTKNMYAQGTIIANV